MSQRVFHVRCYRLNKHHRGGAVEQTCQQFFRSSLCNNNAIRNTQNERVFFSTSKNSEQMLKGKINEIYALCHTIAQELWFNIN